MPEKELPSEFKVRIVRAENLQATPIRGGFGGVMPDGSIVVHLYFEHGTIADVLTHKVEKGGIIDLAAPREEEKDSQVTRTVYATHVLSPISARQIGEWLIKKADEAEEKSTLAKGGLQHDDT